MNLLPLVRQRVVRLLWRRYRDRVPIAGQVARELTRHSLELILDHVALVDLSAGSDARHGLAHLFECIGFVSGGRTGLPGKALTFEWLAEEDAHTKSIWQTLPQIVLAQAQSTDRQMIERMRLPAQHGVAPAELTRAGQAARAGDTAAAMLLYQLCHWELTRRPHRLPTLAEYQAQRAEQPLLAWCAVHARAVNHFGLAVYACAALNTFDAVHEQLTREVGVELNQCQGRTIQGGPALGMAQSATVPIRETIALDGGEVQSQGPFLELVWRYRSQADGDAFAWDAYFRGYVGQNADPIAATISEG
jgi:hypothetical protein